MESVGTCPGSPQSNHLKWGRTKFEERAGATARVWGLLYFMAAFGVPVRVFVDLFCDRVPECLRHLGGGGMLLCQALERARGLGGLWTCSFLRGL